MIRPLTCVCVLLAAGSGLYMYQAKHRTLMLDRQIADVLKQADVARARTAVLKAEYAMLSAPGRLDELSGRFLALKPSQPAQYVQLAALDQHLPPIETFPKPGDVPPPAPTPAAMTDTDTDGDSDAVDHPPAAPAGPAGAAALVATAVPDGPLAGTGTPSAAHMVAAVAPVARGDAEMTAHQVHHAALPGSQFAGNTHPQSMPMAAPRPVQSAVLATAALHPMGTPARPRITNAGYAAYAPPRTRPMPARAETGSMLGSAADMALAPPVPVAN